MEGRGEGGRGRKEIKNYLGSLRDECAALLASSGIPLVVAHQARRRRETFRANWFPAKVPACMLNHLVTIGHLAANGAASQGLFSRYYIRNKKLFAL